MIFLQFLSRDKYFSINDFSEDFSYFDRFLRHIVYDKLDQSFDYRLLLFLMLHFSILGE